MAIGGFLQGLGLAYGNSLIQGVNLEQKQAQADLMKTEAQQAQMQSQQMQQEMQTRKSIGAFIQSQTQLEGADSANPLNQAKMYTKAAGLAASQGDLASAQEMSGLARQAQQDGIEQTKALAQQQAQKKEALATAADNLPDNPSQDQVSDLVRKAVDAGVDPLSIPKPGTPALMTWVNQQKLAGMSSTQRAEFVQKAADAKQRRDQQWQEHEDNVDLRKSQMQQTAQFREMEIGLRRDAMADRTAKGPQTLDIGSAKYEYDPDSKLKGERLATDPRYVKLGDKTTAQQVRDSNMLAGAGAEAARNLEQMGRFGAGTTQSPFVHLTDHDAVDAIKTAGTHALTPEQTQMFESSTSGLALELGRIATAGGGRTANESQIQEIQKQITPRSGDTTLTAAYKLSTAAQMALTRLQASPEPTDPKVKASWDNTIATLQKYPDPDKILEAASAKDKKQLENWNSSYQTLLDKVSADTSGAVGLPGTGDSGAGTTKAPIPPDIQSLVDKYRSK
jgi:hypothetical protein